MEAILDIQLQVAQARLDINDVLRMAGINRVTWWRWTSGKFSPRAASLAKINIALACATPPKP
jgi:hypothetical protein